MVLGAWVPHDTLVTRNVITTVCNDDNYRYGYNGQMKNNQWAGLGNHSVDLAAIRRETGYLNGTITADQLHEKTKAAGTMGLLGMAFVADAYLTKGRLSQFILQLNWWALCMTIHHLVLL